MNKRGDLNVQGTKARHGGREVGQTGTRSLVSMGWEVWSCATEIGMGWARKDMTGS